MSDRTWRDLSRRELLAGVVAAERVAQQRELLSGAALEGILS